MRKVLTVVVLVIVVCFLFSCENKRKYKISEYGGFKGEKPELISTTEESYKNDSIAFFKNEISRIIMECQLPGRTYYSIVKNEEGETLEAEMFKKGDSIVKSLEAKMCRR